MKKCRPKDERTDEQRLFEIKVSLEATSIRIFTRRIEGFQKEIRKIEKEIGKIRGRRSKENRCGGCGGKLHVYENVAYERRMGRILHECPVHGQWNRY